MSERPRVTRAALARSFLDSPSSFDEADQRSLLEHFDAGQIAELILDLIRFRPGSKLMVASGTEPAPMSSSTAEQPESLTVARGALGA